MNDGGGNACSGRAPAGGKTNGTISSTSTVNIGGTTFDFSKAVSGFGSTNFSPPGGFALVFAEYANACGYGANNDAKIGATAIIFTFNGVAQPQVQSYASNQIQVDLWSPPADTPNGTAPGQAPGTCQPNSKGTSGGGGTGINITSIDATHVAGSIDMIVQSATVQGTFDVPLCDGDPSVAPNPNGQTSHCCVQ